MKKMPNRTPHRIAVFGGRYKLLRMLCHSMNYAAKAFNVTVTSVHDACKGKVVACQGFFFREIVSAKITFEDLGKLRLEDFDRVNTPGVTWQTVNTRKRRAIR